MSYRAHARTLFRTRKHKHAKKKKTTNKQTNEHTRTRARTHTRTQHTNTLTPLHTRSPVFTRHDFVICMLTTEVDGLVLYRDSICFNTFATHPRVLVLTQAQLSRTRCVHAACHISCASCHHLCTSSNRAGEAANLCDAGKEACHEHDTVVLVCSK